MRPPLCLTHLPCRVVRVIDGDTVVVALPHSDRVLHVRLIGDGRGCWCAESRGATRELGQAAKREAEKLVEICSAPSLWIPLPSDPLSVLSICTMGRVLGRLFISDSICLGEEMIRRGQAFATKGELNNHVAEWLKRGGA